MEYSKIDCLVDEILEVTPEQSSEMSDRAEADGVDFDELVIEVPLPIWAMRVIGPELAYRSPDSESLEQFKARVQVDVVQLRMAKALAGALRPYLTPTSADESAA